MSDAADLKAALLALDADERKRLWLEMPEASQICWVCGSTGMGARDTDKLDAFLNELLQICMEGAELHRYASSGPEPAKFYEGKAHAFEQLGRVIWQGMEQERCTVDQSETQTASSARQQASTGPARSARATALPIAPGAPMTEPMKTIDTPALPVDTSGGLTESTPSYAHIQVHDSLERYGMGGPGEARDAAIRELIGYMKAHVTISTSFDRMAQFVDEWLDDRLRQAAAGKELAPR